MTVLDKIPDPTAIDLELYRERSFHDHTERAALIAAVEALREQVEIARLEVLQCHAKSTCCCGDYIREHSVYAGHTPVAMYDYVLDRAETRADAGEAHAGELARLVQVLLDNDPNDDAADAVTVLDVWRKEARTTLARTKESTS